MAYDPLTGKYTPDPIKVPTQVAYQPESGKTISGYSTIGQYVDTRVAAMPKVKKVIRRTPRLDKKGKIVGWDLVYDDGTTDFEPNPSYKSEEDSDSKNITLFLRLFLLF